MNLIEDPWLPVVQQDGTPRNASLLDVFLKGKEIADLSVLPHERVALMRLLICIAQSALDGPEDIDDWHDIPENLPQAANEYLTIWKESFDLFHEEKPFLQVAGLTLSSKTTSIAKLALTLASGDLSTLFDHNAGHEKRHIARHRVPISLITYQNFCLGGRESNARWGDIISAGSGGDGPCSGSSMLHTFIRRSSLFETICFNLCTKENIEGQNVEWGKPVWQQVPQKPDDTNAVLNATTSYLGRLVPMSRWIKILDNNEILLGAGFKYLCFPEACQEPSATVVISRDGQKRILLGAQKNKALWRELSAISVNRSQDYGGALVLNNLSENDEVDIHALALIRKRGLQVKEDMMESVLHIPAQMRCDVGRNAYKDEVKFAERKAALLGKAIETYRQEIDRDWQLRVKAAKNKLELLALLHSVATTNYWTAVEKNLPLLMNYIASFGDAELVTNTKKAWRRMLHRTARESYEVACGHETPRQLRAFSFGLKKLEGYGKHKEEVIE